MRIVRFAYDTTLGSITMVVTRLWQVEGNQASLLLTARCGIISYVCGKAENADLRSGYGSLPPTTAQLVWGDYFRRLASLQPVSGPLPFSLRRTLVNDLYLLRHGPANFHTLPMAEYPVVGSWLEALVWRSEGYSLALAA